MNISSECDTFSVNEISKFHPIQHIKSRIKLRLRLLLPADQEKKQKRNEFKHPHQKYFRWLFLVQCCNPSPGVKSLLGNCVNPAPCRIPWPVCDTSSMAPPRGLVTTPISPFPTPVMTPLAASRTSLARCIPCRGWSTMPATAPRRLRANPPKPWERPALDNKTDSESYQQVHLHTQFFKPSWNAMLTNLVPKARKVASIAT